MTLTFSFRSLPHTRTVPSCAQVARWSAVSSNDMPWIGALCAAICRTWPPADAKSSHHQQSHWQRLDGAANEHMSGCIGFLLADSWRPESPPRCPGSPTGALCLTTCLAQAPAGQQPLLRRLTLQRCMHAGAEVGSERPGASFVLGLSAAAQLHCRPMSTLSEMARQAAEAVASSVVRSQPRRWYLSLGSSSAWSASKAAAAVGIAPDAPRLPLRSCGTEAADGIAAVASSVGPESSADFR